MKDPNNPCIFCSIRKNELIFENSLAYASKDSYPVTKFHSLVVPKRCIKNYFELNDKEILACDDLIKKLNSYDATKVDILLVHKKKFLRLVPLIYYLLEIINIIHQRITAISETQLII